MTQVLILSPCYPIPENSANGIFVHRQVMGLRRAGATCDVLRYRPAGATGLAAMLRRAWWARTWHRRGTDGSLPEAPVQELLYERTWKEGEDEVPALAAALEESLRSMERRPDVLYAHWLWPAGAAAILAGKACGVPVAAIARGSELGPWLDRSSHCGPWVDRVIREADLVLGNCAYLRDRCVERVPERDERLGVIYNGCDTEAFRPADDRATVRAALALDPDDRVLLFCGGLITVKGVPELLHAWGRFQDEFPRWRLVLAGGGADEESRTALAHADLRRVHSTGRLAPSDLLPWFQAADAYVQPSRSEGLSNATMEAMACGLPVITTRVAGQPELVTDGVDGRLLEPGDGDALLQVLRELANDAARAASLGSAARETIVARFNPDDQARALAALLADLATASEGDEGRGA